MFSKNIKNPKIPFNEKLSFSPIVGTKFRIEGVSFPAGDRFYISLANGPRNEANVDIPLHISVRLAEGYIARNNFKAGVGWRRELGKDQGLPIKPGDNFSIVIIIEANNYEIAVNGNEFCEFPHRMPYQEISHLQIDGDLRINSITFGQQEYPPLPLKLIGMPVCMKLPSAPLAGSKVIIQGCPRPKCLRFDISLATASKGTTMYPGCDTPFHMSVRMDEGRIARNNFTLQKGWSKELGQGALPIHHGTPFTIAIVFETNFYSIAINEKAFCEFPHRAPYQEVTHLLIDGDVSITSIKFLQY